MIMKGQMKIVRKAYRHGFISRTSKQNFFCSGFLPMMMLANGAITNPYHKEIMGYGFRLMKDKSDLERKSFC